MSLKREFNTFRCPKNRSDTNTSLLRGTNKIIQTNCPLSRTTSWSRKSGRLPNTTDWSYLCPRRTAICFRSYWRTDIYYYHCSPALSGESSLLNQYCYQWKQHCLYHWATVYNHLWDSSSWGEGDLFFQSWQRCLHNKSTIHNLWDTSIHLRNRASRFQLCCQRVSTPVRRERELRLPHKRQLWI